MGVTLNIYERFCYCYSKKDFIGCGEMVRKSLDILIDKSFPDQAKIPVQADAKIGQLVEMFHLRDKHLPSPEEFAGLSLDIYLRFFYYPGNPTVNN